MTGRPFLALPREIDRSELWLRKPAVWLQTWLWICLRTQFRGPAAGQTDEVNYRRAQLAVPTLSADQWTRLIAWLRSERWVSTKRTPRGMVITILPGPHSPIREHQFAGPAASAQQAEAPKPRRHLTLRQLAHIQAAAEQRMQYLQEKSADIRATERWQQEHAQLRKHLLRLRKSVALYGYEDTTPA